MKNLMCVSCKGNPPRSGAGARAKLCQDCFDRRAVTKICTKCQETFHSTNSSTKCTACIVALRRQPCEGCGKNNPRQALLCFQCDETGAIPETRPRCSKCKVGVARNVRGTPVCEDCHYSKSTKYRNCRNCDKSFKTSNNSTLCSSCIHQKKKHPCLECGKWVDARAQTCRECFWVKRRQQLSDNRLDRTKSSGGYILRIDPLHPRAHQGRVYEHILVMEEHLGRYLLPHETIHHKNGQRDDNRLSNLELWSTSQPAGQRVEDKLEWAHELIALYETRPTV